MIGMTQAATAREDLNSLTERQHCGRLKLPRVTQYQNISLPNAETFLPRWHPC